MPRVRLWLLALLLVLGLPLGTFAQVMPPGGGGNPAFPAGSCTNSTVTGITSLGGLTCSPVTALMTDSTIAKTGTDIDVNGRVIATHFPTPLPFLQGGHGLPSGAPGGLLYFPTSTSLGSSNTLPQGMPVLGGGFAQMPTTGTKTADSTLFAMASGPTTTNRQLMYDELGNVVITAFPPGLPTQPGLTWAVNPQLCTQDTNHGKVTVNVTGQLICAPDEGGTGGGGGLATMIPDGGATNLVCGTAGRGALQVMDSGEWQYCDGASTSVLHSGVPTQTGLTWNVDVAQCQNDTLNGGKITVDATGHLVCRPDSGFGAVLAGTAGRVPVYATAGSTLSDSGIIAVQLVTASTPYTAGGRLVQSTGANRDTSDSGLLASTVVTAGSAFVAGRLTQAGGNDRTIADSGVLASQVLTAGLPFVAGNLVQATGNNRQTGDSGLAVTSLCTTTGVCPGYQPLLSWGAGLTVSGTVAAVASTEAGFLTNGVATDLVCGVGNAGKAQVLASGEWSYCDGAPSPALRKGLPTQSGLTWNVNPATCNTDPSGGKLTVTGLGAIQCAVDQGGATSITAVGTVVSGAAFTDLAPGARLTFGPISAPAVPASGSATVYVMAGAKNLAVRDDAGVVKHMVQTRTAVANNFATSISDDGTVSVAQPAISSLTDAALVVRTNALNTFGGGGGLTGLPSPSNASDVATKSYVDSVSGGLSPRGAVRVSTTGALTATYSNGTGGVGATLTNSGTQAALQIDGVTLTVNDRVLVKDQPTTPQNGIFVVSVVGTGSTNWVLVRATDYDADVEIVAGSYVSVGGEGLTHAGSLWIETTLGPFTVGTTPITFNILNLSQSMALTGDVTGSGIGSIPTTVSKINSVPFAGTAGHLVSFASGVTPGDSGLVAAQVVTAPTVFVTGGLLAGGGANRVAQDSGVLAAQVVTAASAYVAGEFLVAAGADRTTQSSGVQASLLVSAPSALGSGTLVQGSGAPRGVSDSGVLAGQVLTSVSAFTSGQVVVAAAANRTTQTTGLIAAQLVTAASVYVSGNLLVAAGNNRTTADSGISASILCTTTSICSGYQPAGPYAVQGTTLTVQGTSGEITSSAAGQDLSTSRTWTLGLANPLNLSGKTLVGGTPLVFDGATPGGFATTLVVVDPTAARTFTIPNANTVAVQPDTGTAGQFLTGISALGVISKAPIAFSDLPGLLGCAQLPALTGDVTTSAGSCATLVSRINGAVFSGTTGNLVSFATSNTPADSGVAAVQVVTAAAALTTGNLVAAAANSRATVDSGVSAAQVLTAASAFTSGQVVVAAGSNRTTQTTGIAAANLCTNTGICAGYQAALTAGAGVTLTGAVLATSSIKPGFLTDGSVTDLVCGAGNQGKAQVMDNGEWQYCDGATTALLRKGLPTQSGLKWNVNPTTCNTDTNLGKLTVNASQEIICSPDISGGGSGLITAVGTTTSGAAFTDSAPGQRLTFGPIATPTTPAANAASVYVDSLSKVLAVINDLGVVSHTVITQNPVTHFFVTGIADNGVVQTARPSSANLSDGSTLAHGTITTGLTGQGTYYGAPTTLAPSDGLLMDAGSVLRVKPHVTTVTNANYTVVDDFIIVCNAGASDRTIQLPSAATSKTGLIRLIKGDTGTGSCKGTHAGSDVINDSAGTADVVAQWDMVEFELVDSGSPGKWHATFATASPFEVASKSATYGITLSDFAKFRTLVVPSGTFTMTLPVSTTPPAMGQWIHIINYGSGVVTLARNGQTLNGGTNPLTLGAASATAPTSMWVISDGANFFAWIAGAAAGGASKGTIHLNVAGPKLPTSGAAVIDNSGNNTMLTFDGGVGQCAWWQFVVPQDYGSNPKIRMEYRMVSSTGGITMDFTVMDTAPGATVPIETDSYGASNLCTDSATPATAGWPDELLCTITNTDGLAAGHNGKIKACRVPTDAGDTATGTLGALGLVLEYTKN